MPPRSFTIRVGTNCLLAACLAWAGTGHAATLADVQLIDRASGQSLPLYRHRGEYWVAGRPGASYAIQVGNRTGQRILAVISVDGVNVITGRTASATPDDGYVFSPWENTAITGWRKNAQQVAAFYFSDRSASYASRTGRPDDVGVIGVALFSERRQPPRPLPRSAPYSGEADAAAKSRSAAPSAEMAAPAPSLGTGHGAIENSYSGTTEFTSATARPVQLLRIRYDSHANLVAQGVIPQPRPHQRPNPFPATGNGYVPDPPRW
ncbi:MAG: hypothetical protein ACN6O3_15570 [Comamonas sp.]